ncbi:MAG TPA: PAS domain S-box protein [Candidatus Limnocylindrales bacterium]|nr:PAS domain S-box protein [Candidatus Limnocylindrales bacterium]
MKNRPAKVALRTCLVYAVIGSAWILLSGRVLFALVPDPALRNRLEIYKGWTFVATTALALYFLLRSQLRRTAEEAVERRQAEEGLLEKTALLEAQLNSSIEAILVVDNHGKKVIQNQRTIDLWKIPQDIANNHDDEKQVQFVMNQTKNPEKFVEKVVYLYSHPNEISRDEVELKDGTVLDRYSAPVVGKDGKCYGRIWSFRDISHTKRAEEALKQSQERLREVMRSTRCILNCGEVEAPEGWRERVMNELTIFHWNFPVLNEEAAQEVFPLDVPPDKTYQQVWSESRNPEDFNEMHKVTREALLHDKPFYRNEFRCTDKHGIEHWMQEFITIHKLGENRWQIFGINTDITDLKKSESALRESEAKFRSYVENAPLAVFVADEKGCLVDCNPAAVNLLGYDAATLLGTSIKDLHPAEDLEKVRQAYQILATEKHVEGEYRFKRRDGKSIWVSLRAVMTESSLSICFCQDITERRQVAEAIANERQLLRTLIDLLPETFYVKDRDSRFLIANEALAKHFGKESPSQIVGRTDADFYPNEAAAAFRAAELEVLNGEPLIDHEGKGVSPAGQKCIHLTTKVPFRDSQGRIQGLVGIGRDITERKQAEEELHRLNRSLETLSKCNEVVVRATDETTLLTKICQIITEIGGFRLAWVGYSGQDESKSVRPVAWAGAGAGYLENLQISWADTERGRGPTGTAIRTGRPTTFANLAENPDFAPWREEALRHGFSSSIGLPLKADDKIFGVLSVFSSQADAFNPSETALLMELADDLAFGIATLRNRVQRRHLEEQLRQSQKMEAVGQLAGGVAHDFNNLLTVIQGNASLLLNPQLDTAERSGCSRQIVQAAERAASLTRQLLIFSRKQVMRPANVDLNEVVANMTKMLRRVLGEDIVLQTNYVSELALIHADTGMIEQVLMNLLVNARDAMPTGGQLSISTSKEEFTKAQVEKNHDAVAGTHVRLAVRDTGCGIPKENLPRIFEPFFTTKAVGKGTGLGLATVYSIVQQHRGWITASSEVNKGTTFNIYFPAVEGERLEKDPLLAVAKLPHGTGTILVVEDELAVRLLVSNLLQRCGYTVLAAESGVAAMKVWQEHQDRIQLLLTDIIMPDGMNGYELAQQLQTARPGLKVVYTSGYSGEVVGKSLNLIDGVNFLQKPYLPQKLLQILQDHLGRN